MHDRIISDAAGDRYRGPSRSLYVEAVRPALEELVAGGKIGAWGITGVGMPSAILETLEENPAPAAIQAVANILDSGLGVQELLKDKNSGESAGPRDILAAAHRRGIPVMGVRAVQAGALTDSFDRNVLADRQEMADYNRAQPFRALAKELGESAASLAHRYSLSMKGISTVVLGVKNRIELRECIAAEEKGSLDSGLIARIDGAVSI